jgi:ParB family chromosome partitioning protein
MATFGTRSKGVLSEMIALVRKLPDELVMAIGSAPGIGRPRWDAMAAMLDDGKGDWKSLIQKTDFQKLSSADRFERMIKELRPKPTKKGRGAEDHQSWASADKSVSVIAKSGPKGVSLEITKTDAKPFADWITGNLDSLYEAFRKSKREN